MNVEWHLRGAKEELDSAHAAALIEDPVFAHEVAQFVFAVGALGEAWRVRKRKLMVESPEGTDPSPLPSPLGVEREKSGSPDV